MPKYTIDTLIRLTSPLHITEPGDAYWNPYTESFVAGSTNDRFPCSRTKYMAMGAPSSADDKTDRLRVPIIPGNSQRGKLRRQMARVVYAILAARGEKISFDLYHIMQCGSASASPDGSTTVSETAKAAKHPVSGLFGGGPKLVWGQTSVGHAYPITPDTLNGKIVPEQFAEHSIKGKLTGVATFSKVDDILRGTGGVPEIIQDADAAIAKWLAFLGESAKNKEAKSDAKSKDEVKVEDAGEKKRHLSTIACKEYLMPGVTLHAAHIVDTDLIGDAGMGLFILALAGMANEQRMGGNYREGWGRFTLQAAGSVIGNGETSFDVLAQVNGKYVPNAADSSVERFIKAWGDFSPTITAAGLAKLFSVE